MARRRRRRPMPAPAGEPQHNPKVVPHPTKPQTWVSRWNSVEEFAHAAKHATEHRAEGSDDSSTSHSKGDRSWDLGQGFDLVYERSISGWPEASKDIAKVVVPLVDKITAQIEQDHYDFVDDGSIASDFDVPTLLTGEPSHWLQHRTEIIEGKGHRIIRIGAATRNTAGVRAEGMYRRGVITAAIAYCLEAAGFGVEIIGVGKTEAWGNGTYYSFTKVKGAGEILDLNRVAVAVANPGFQRRLDFAIRESDSRLVACEIGRGGYGSSRDLSPDEIEQEKLDIYVPVGAATVRPDDLVDYVLHELRKQGVKIKGDKEVAA